MNIKEMIMSIISFLLMALLAPTALAAAESYSPTDPLLAVIWPLVSVFFLLSIGLGFLYAALKG